MSISVLFIIRTELFWDQGKTFSFDPGIFRDDDGGIYLYSKCTIRPEMGKWGEGVRGNELQEDMLTIKEEPHRLMPTVMDSKGQASKDMNSLKRAR